MTRLAALIRDALDVPSRAEVRALRQRQVEQSMLWSLTALERTPPEGYLPGEAAADLDHALAAYGGLQPLAPPAPLPERPPIAVMLAAAALLLILAASTMVSCTIRGAESCSDVGGCERPDMRAVDLRPVCVPAPGGGPL